MTPYRHIQHLILAAALLLLLAACSTTSHLTDDEVLYTGISRTDVHDRLDTPAEETALAEVEAALAYAPNGAFMGSSTMRTPFPIGLWIYNAYVDKPRKGFNKWMFESFSTPPVTIDKVAPATRTKVATNLLQNYGYFQGSVSHSIVPQSNPRKQKIAYDITLGPPYLLDSIRYIFPTIEDSIIRARMRNANIHRGDQFSTLALTSEKERIVSDLRNNGFYFYRTDYINYLADTVAKPQRVQLLVAADPNIPHRAGHQYYIGKIYTYIRQNMNSRYAIERRKTGNIATYDDSTRVKRLQTAWQGNRIPLAPRVLGKNFIFRPDQLFSQRRVDRTTANLRSMDIFSGVRFTFTPSDTTDTCDTLDVRLDLTMDQLVDAELDFSITQKSNSQIGPHLGLTISKRNAFHHGETLSVGLKGSYEWQTQKQFGENKRIDSFEAGADVSLVYPWIAFPWLHKKFYTYPTSTKFKVGANQLNRANYYRLMSFSAEATYNFQTSRTWSHSFTPITVSYNKLQRTTAHFDSIVSHNSALYVSMRNQFVPAMQYTITFDNSFRRRLLHTTHVEATVKEASNFLNLTNAFLGFDYYKKDKLLLRTPYSQFLKFLIQLKNTFRLTENTRLATRLQLGAIWTYGNSNYAPYSELFYVGGANSIRAFTVRSIGPGRYHDRTGRGTYLDQAGDLKLELNAEYRFPIVNTLQGALFVDAGNVWLMHDDAEHPGGQLNAEHFFKDIALGTGFGLRYDLEFLILRLDLGIGIHAPYDTGKSGYYNIPKLKDGLGLHFAVGYPF